MSNESRTIPREYFLIPEMAHYDALAIIKTACDALEESLDIGDRHVTTLKTGIAALERDTIEPQELPPEGNEPPNRDSNQQQTAPITNGQRTARLTDAADETEAGIRELVAALEAAALSDLDAEGSRAALGGYAKLARMALESARKSAELAEAAYYEQTRPASAA